MTRAWVYLFIAGVLETVWAIGLKYSQGLTRPLATTITVVALAASMYLLALAMKSLPVGTAYAVWTGIGAVGAAIFGIVLFGEAKNALRIASLLLIIAGIIGLKFTSRST